MLSEVGDGVQALTAHTASCGTSARFSSLSPFGIVFCLAITHGLPVIHGQWPLSEVCDHDCRFFPEEQHYHEVESVWIRRLAECLGESFPAKWVKLCAILY